MAALGPRVAFAAFALVALFVAHADTLRCYTCSTVANKNCGDPFNKSYVPMTDCQSVGVTGAQPKEVPVCKKVKQRVNNGDLQTVRSCAWVKPEEPCPPSPSGAYIREEECSTCTSDLCNAATAFSPALLPLAAVAAATAYSVL
uniref:Ly-6/neurotoxin 1 n=1 Tax=Locusta migratoria TaxID=7004 RepID=A0A0G3I8D5_LOCMI|nr:Ly-6/neurotoxin 1 [Locusta migratoria]